MSRKALIPLLTVVTVFGLTMVVNKSKTVTTVKKKVCEEEPPTRQPKVPPGYTLYRGPIDALARGVAVNMLGSHIGDFQDFEDESGRELAALVLWHCNEPGSGRKPEGWHKGVTLFEKKVVA